MNDITENIRQIKHDFMAYRNGIVSETLRKAGMPYKVIFGLQLPQLSEIARRQERSEALADALWADTGVRESRLLACYIYNPTAISEEKALNLARSVQTVEEADILCFRLLRRLPFAPALAESLGTTDSELPRYCGKALLRNLLS